MSSCPLGTPPLYLHRNCAVIRVFKSACKPSNSFRYGFAGYIRSSRLCFGRIRRAGLFRLNCRCLLWGFAVLSNFVEYWHDKFAVERPSVLQLKWKQFLKKCLLSDLREYCFGLPLLANRWCPPQKTSCIITEKIYWLYL